MPSIPSSASPDFTSSSLNGLMIASIFFMSGSHPPFLPRAREPLRLFQEVTQVKMLLGSTTPSKSTSSQGVHAHGLLLTFHPLFPFGRSTPLVTVPREL